MRISKKYLFCFLYLIFLSFYIPESYAQTDYYRFMREGFEQPAAKYRPSVYHWWLGGNVDTIRLKEELTALNKAGVSGITLFEIGSRDTVHVKNGPEFLGDESLATIKFAIEEAGKLGMEVSMNVSSSWNAGGNWVTPEYAAKSIYLSSIQPEGSGPQKIIIPYPEALKKDGSNPRIEYIKFKDNGRPVFSEEIAVLAVPVVDNTTEIDTSRIINISQYFNPETETLQWNVPNGKWEILRFVCSNSGENLILPSKNSDGPIIDHFDANATEFNFSYVINRLESVLGDLSNSALKSLYMASYEAKQLTWTPSLPQVFKEINGYDLYKFLPLFFEYKIVPPESTNRFRRDYQSTLSELMITNYYQKSREVCNRHGLKNNAEAGGPGFPLHNVPVEPLRAQGALDIPRGEFWINHNNWTDNGIDILRVIKETSAASHIYDKGIVEMEAFTSFQHWQEGPYEMKPIGDRAFTEGMNKVVVHGSTHNPPGTGFPGIVYHAGTHYNDKRVWWPKIRPFNEYLSRVSFIATEADFFADVLYYYGDSIPNFGGHKHSRFTPGVGYDYEIINSEILKQLEVKNNKLIIPKTGAEFSVLYLKKEFGMRPDILDKLEILANQGAVIIGAKPQTLYFKGNYSDNQYQNKINRLWKKYDNKLFGGNNHSIYYDITVPEILKALSMEPDLKYSGNEYSTLDYIHYKKNDYDFYFIRNSTDSWITKEISFRQINKTPEIWDAETGDIYPISILNSKSNITTLPLSLAPFGSVIVTFKPESAHHLYENIIDLNNTGKPPLLTYTDEGICLWENGFYELVNSDGKKQRINNFVRDNEITGAWDIYFSENLGAPEKFTIPKLMSWTDTNIDGIKYYSGIARYEKFFIRDFNEDNIENSKIYLDLGDLWSVGEVWLNDKPLGIGWTKPYRFDITEIIKPGVNKLVIEIANTWSNRLKGDAVTGENFTSTNIVTTKVKDTREIYYPWKDVPLIDSGLFGPVKIKTVKIYKTKIDNSLGNKNPLLKAPHDKLARK